MLASRLHWRLLIGTILALMAAAWLAPRWIPAPGIQENRVLAERPAWPRRLQDVAAFRKAADAYVADRFPIRPHLIAVLNRVRMLAGVSGSNRVIVGRDGWLFYDNDSHLGDARGDPALLGPQIRSWLVTVAGRTEYGRAHGMPYLIVVPPSKETTYPQHAPAWYHGPGPNRSAILLPKLAAATGAGEALYLYPMVRQATDAGQETFSRLDTHWTGYGAYAGYVGLMNRLHTMGLTDGPKPISDFQRVELGLRGPRDMALMLGVSSFVRLDYPHLDNLPGEARRRIIYLTPKQDWTAPLVIDTGETGKPVLLMTRDSFSNEMLPFLFPHFSRIVLAHNQDGFWRQDLIDRFKPNLIVLEVIESSLRFGEGEGPPASPEAVARIDRVLGSVAPPRAVTTMPLLVPPNAKTTAIVASAVISGNCNVEQAQLTPGEGGEATFAVSGWLSELGKQITSPNGFVVLKGPQGAFVGDLRMDQKRPDVAAYYKNPFGEQSGFTRTFYLRKVPPGLYTLMVYRRAGAGWIGCAGKPTVTAR
ncbi:hypothetical protein [Phenylobacterium sp.]|uniref:alginate O-acetyltransferase AlgX-related protein n=1 Tax=Phenylobacterium sp. TaxID=1871053 RepID=UPI0035675091